MSPSQKDFLRVILELADALDNIHCLDRPHRLDNPWTEIAALDALDALAAERKPK